MHRRWPTWNTNFISPLLIYPSFGLSPTFFCQFLAILILCCSDLTSSFTLPAVSVEKVVMVKLYSSYSISIVGEATILRGRNELVYCVVDEKPERIVVRSK